MSKEIELETPSSHHLDSRKPPRGTNSAQNCEPQAIAGGAKLASAMSQGEPETQESSSSRSDDGSKRSADAFSSLPKPREPAQCRRAADEIGTGARSLDSHELHEIKGFVRDRGRVTLRGLLESLRCGFGGESHATVGGRQGSEARTDELGSSGGEKSPRVSGPGEREPLAMATEPC